MKKTRKRKVTHAPTRSARTDDKSFLIIVAGGFLLILVGLFFFTNRQNAARSAIKDSMQKMHLSKENVVIIKEYTFIPETITVKPGEMVVWQNQDKVSHKPTATDDSFTTGTIFEGGEGAYTFTMPGTYSYYSATYPNVQGTVVVTE